jgi:hypothetical protein
LWPEKKAIKKAILASEKSGGGHSAITEASKYIILTKAEARKQKENKGQK